MTNDIRYSELQFLRAIADSSIDIFNPLDERQRKAFDVGGMYVEMAAALIEDLYIRFHSEEVQQLVAKLRGELFPLERPSGVVKDYDWINPRAGLERILSANNLQRLRITYRGLRRIEELRDILRSERILEPFGVLLSMQYFRRDLEDALKSGIDVSVSVLYADMDDFKRINTEFGQNAGDVVMKSYLEVMRDCLGLLGEGYRGVGDEVAAIVAGQRHERVVEIAEKIRKGVEAMRCEYKGKKLPQVTASIGVATAPPESRTPDVEIVAQDRKQQAKDNGKNRVIAT